MAIPRGSALGSLSGIWGIPVLLLKRTETGVDGAWKCGALESFAASEVGVKVPVRRTPFACAEGKVSEAEEYWGEGRKRTWSKAWMLAEDGLQLGYEIFARLHDLLV